MRADRLGRGFTPALDRLAAQGLRFAEARTSVPLTLPAHTSIMTGQLPPAHGIRINGAARLQGTPTLAAMLKAAGYQTRAVVGAFVLDRRFGLDHGFDDYDDQITRDPDAMDLFQAERRRPVIVSRSSDGDDRRLRARPGCCGSISTILTRPTRRRRPRLARAKGAAYDGEIAYVDAADRAAAGRGRWPAPMRARTAVIVAGDHGESLGEHGEPTHGMLLFEPALRVPLIVRAPGVTAGGTPRSCEHDRHRSDRARAGRPARAPGTAATCSAPPPPAGMETYSETEYPRVAAWAPARSLIRDRWKVIVSDRAALFNLAEDPEEARDLSAAQPCARQSDVGAARHPSRAPPSRRRPAAVSPETANRLRSLGYVATDLAAPPADGGVNAADAMPAWAAFETALCDVTAGRVAQSLPALAKVSAAYPASPIFAATYARALAAAGRKTAGAREVPRRRQAVAGRCVALSRAGGGRARAWSRGGSRCAPKKPRSRSNAARASGVQRQGPAAGRRRPRPRGRDRRSRPRCSAIRPMRCTPPTSATRCRAMGELDGAGAAYRRALERAPVA